MPETRLVLRDIDVPDIERLEVYRRAGGYAAAIRALTRMERAAVVDAVARAGLRRRAGTWPLMAQDWLALPRAPRYLAVAAHVCEPGTYRDRKLIERNPHQVLEGTILACCALGAEHAAVFVHPAWERARALLARAVDEAAQAGLLGENVLSSGRRLRVEVRQAAGGLVTGEPSALLRLWEGRRPVPADRERSLELHGHPAHVETASDLAYLPHALTDPEAFAALGSPAYTGTCVFSVSGPVRRPGLYEIALGAATLRELIDAYAGGVRPGQRLKGALPGGLYAPVVPADQVDIPLDPAAWAVPGGGPHEGAMGTGGVVVLDDATCAVAAALNLVAVFAGESCGQCPACAAGTRWAHQALTRLEAGQGTAADLEGLERVARSIAPFPAGSHVALCGLAQAFAWTVQGFLNAFRSEFEEHVQAGACPIEQDHAIKTPETVSVRF